MISRKWDWFFDVEANRVVGGDSCYPSQDAAASPLRASSHPAERVPSPPAPPQSSASRSAPPLSSLLPPPPPSMSMSTSLRAPSRRCQPLQKSMKHQFLIHQRVFSRMSILHLTESHELLLVDRPLSHPQG